MIERKSQCEGRDTRCERHNGGLESESVSGDRGGKSGAVVAKQAPQQVTSLGDTGRMTRLRKSEFSEM
jgi:hypothetical protein